MSFKKNENQQLSFDDSYMRQSDRSKRYLEKSWALSFAKEIFPRINEERFRVLYSEHQFSRPNTPVNVIIGALMLKEMNQLTDDELLESILFDVRYQYALHTTSFEEQPFSDRTVSRFRTRLLEYERETGVDLLKGTSKNSRQIRRDIVYLKDETDRVFYGRQQINAAIVNRRSPGESGKSDQL
jgi:hypothetical protein